MWVESPALVFGPGFVLSSRVVVLVLAVVIGTALVVLATLTLGPSVVQAVRDSRRAQVRGELQDAMVDRLFDPETEWSD